MKRGINQFTYKPLIGKFLLKEYYYKKNMSQKEIGKLIGCSQSCVMDLMKHHNLKARIAAKRDQLGKNNSMWSGGKIEHHGYILIKDRDHPRSDNRGYVPEHVLIIEKNIGRYLKHDEVIHHLDRNKKNNIISNLKLMKAKDHNELHKKLSMYNKKKIILDVIKMSDSGSSVLMINKKYNQLSQQTIYNWINRNGKYLKEIIK